MNSLLDRILNNKSLEHIRRNHGLEHATIHILSARYPRTSLAGRSDHKGFLLLGNVPTEAVEQAAQEALTRLRNGERDLAIHPNCGTNLLTAGVLASSASYAAMMGDNEGSWSDRLSRLPLAIAATVLALLIAKPLGSAAQKHITTSANPGDLAIHGVEKMSYGSTTLHRVNTAL